MLKLNPIFIVALFLLGLPFLLPYIEYDIYTPFTLENFLQPRDVVKLDHILYGNKTIMSYVPLIFSLFPLALLNFKNTLATRIILLVSSSVVFLAQILGYFALTADPSFYNGFKDVKPLIGYYTQSLGALTLLSGAILILLPKHLFKAKMMEEAVEEEELVTGSDLLDDSI